MRAGLARRCKSLHVEKRQSWFSRSYIEQQGKAQESGMANALVGAYLNSIGLPQRAIMYITNASPPIATCRDLFRVSWLKVTLKSLFKESRLLYSKSQIGVSLSPFSLLFVEGLRRRALAAYTLPAGALLRFRLLDPRPKGSASWSGCSRRAGCSGKEERNRSGKKERKSRTSSLFSLLPGFLV